MSSQSNLIKFIILRSLALTIALLFFDFFISINESIPLVVLAITTGTVLATWLKKSNFNFLAALATALFCWITPKILFFIIQLPITDNNLLFTLYSFFEHTGFHVLIGIAALISSYIALQFRSYLQLEFLLLQFLTVMLLAAHRNYHFDLVKKINELAWQFNLSPLIVLTAGAAMAIFLAVIYLFSSNSAIFSYASVHEVSGRPGLNWQKVMLLIFSAIMVYLLGRLVYFFHFSQLDSRLTNGVSSAGKEGVSPLDFHSALGSSNQPTAVVRLNGDYNENPFSPMLYFRESALSELIDNHLVLADKSFDLDLSRSSVSETFKRSEIPEYILRKDLDHSVYLLNDHSLAFAVDYPVKITPLKLGKDQKKFKSAYKAISMVPAFKLNSLVNAKIGNSNWTKETLEHYTSTHKDPRYAQKAGEITRGVTNPLRQVQTLVEYLSKESIYTLKPDHQIKEGEDPTAPYLFGDLRGYCVHFAHATVYMLRALGIPARIGTGYLTDLSQSKDGHILLRASDRHAWPEVYIENYGWIPFDVTPEKVESSAESAVDQNMLDELIDLLGTDEEIINDDLIKDEFSEEPGSLEKYLPAFKYLLLLLPLSFIFLYFIKAYQQLAFMFIKDPQARIKFLYLKAFCLLHDLGYRKKSGETKDEYLQRVCKIFDLYNSQLAPALNTQIYASTEYADFADNLHSRIYKKLTLQQKIMAFISPRSALKGFGLWNW